MGKMILIAVYGGDGGEEGSGVVLLLHLPIYGILSMYPVMLWDEAGGCVD